MALAVGPVTAGERGPELTAAQGGNPLAQSNSKNGVAVLKVAGMLPGEPPATGVVTIKNTGDDGGAFAIKAQNLDENGGPMADAIDFRIDDVTSPSNPVSKYTGKLAKVGSVSLGEIEDGTERTYLLTAGLPASAGNDVQGASAAVDFVWNETELAGAGDVAGETDSGANGDDGNVAGDGGSGSSGTSGSIPFTGFPALLVALLGALSAASGAALRRRLR
jgi:hypothetical protein